jgi:hypothetical protein
MKYAFGLGMAFGSVFCALLLTLGVITNLWAFAGGLFVGWALIEIILNTMDDE